MNTIRNSNGFSAVYLVLVLVIVGIAGATGWFVFNANNREESSKDGSSAVASSSSSGKKSSDTELKITESDQFLDTFYGLYRAEVGNDERLNLVKKYGTENLVNYYTAHQGESDPIVCAQDPGPSHRVEFSSSDGPSASVLSVYIEFDEPIIIVAKVVDQDGLKIDSLQCPAVWQALAKEDR